MPIQAHNLPWASLAANFEYRPAKSGIPGPQGADIHPRGLPTQTQQLEYFIVEFQKELDKHERYLRSKLKPAEDYKARASTWKISIEREFRPTTAPHSTPSSALKLGCDSNTRRRTKPKEAVAETQELRSQIALLQSGWPSEIETRPVFDLERLRKYGPFRHSLSCPIDEFGSIERWTDPEVHPSLDRGGWDMGNSVRTRTEVIKLMIIDAAAQDQKLESSFDLESLLLLAHHPHACWSDCAYTAMDCCNIRCGISNLAEFTLKYLLYFGLLETMIDGGEDRMMSFVPGYEGMRSYMTLFSGRDLVSWLTASHIHLAETVPFIMSSWDTVRFTEDGHQRWPECYVLSKDVMSDRMELAALTKWMWKVLVVSVLLMRETNSEYIGWERNIVRALNDIFWSKNIFGMRWIDYEDIRWPFYGLPRPDVESSDEDDEEA
jgi:hypothetical protein